MVSPVAELFQIINALMAMAEHVKSNFKQTAETAGVGDLTEALRWGQPAYLTEQSGSGTTIRLDCFEGDKVALLVHCQTSLVETYRALFPTEFEYSKNRAIALDPDKPLASKELRTCIGMALTYKLDQRLQIKRRA